MTIQYLIILSHIPVPARWKDKTRTTARRSQTGRTSSNVKLRHHVTCMSHLSLFRIHVFPILTSTKNASLIITDFLAMVYKNEEPRTASLFRGWAMLEYDFNLISGDARYSNDVIQAQRTHEGIMHQSLMISI